MKTPKKGKLVRLRWVQSDGKAPCYTCQFHNYDTLTPSSHIIVREYENVTQKVFFCGEHFMPAWKSANGITDAECVPLKVEDVA